MTMRGRVWKIRQGALPASIDRAIVRINYNWFKMYRYDPKTPLLAVSSAPSLYPKTCDNSAKIESFDPSQNRTLSQSSFCRVRGKALLNPLNVFSPIS